jgi:NAD(P)-dependent dehydrogenase (short-subunit alcohol dehydrogenase family)
MERRFVDLGAELIICGRLELLEATAAQIRSDLDGKVGAIRCDIRDGGAVDAMMDAIWRDAPLDVLVNNAAAAPATSTARWWCRTAARTYAVPAPRISCNGATRSGSSRGRPGRRPEDKLRNMSATAF